jgi:hypothetical protein
MDIELVPYIACAYFIVYLDIFEAAIAIIAIAVLKLAGLPNNMGRFAKTCRGLIIIVGVICTSTVLGLIYIAFLFTIHLASIDCNAPINDVAIFNLVCNNTLA